MKLFSLSFQYLLFASGFLSQIVCSNLRPEEYKWDTPETGFLTMDLQTGFLTASVELNVLGTYQTVMSYNASSSSNTFYLVFDLEVVPADNLVQLDVDVIDNVIQEGTVKTLASIATVPQREDLDWSLVGSSCDLSFLQIVEQSDQVLLKSTADLDYDAGCSAMSSVRLMVTQGEGVQQIFDIESTFVVLNVNDELPSCGGPSAFLELTINETLEGEQATFEVDLLAQDLDSDPFNAFTLSLHPADKNAEYLLEKEIVSLLNSRIFVQSTADNPINRESFPVQKDSLYSTVLFIVEATDSSDVLMKSSCTFKLNIGDLNEFSPVCSTQSNSKNLLKVLEDVAIGFVIGKVACEDEDSSTIPPTEFALIEGNEFFSIDKLSGVISSVVQYDFETKQAYQLTVLATNGMLQSNVIVQIEVINTNDEMPVLEVDPKIVVQGKLALKKFT